MVNKITTPPTTSELIDKVNELVDDKQDKLAVGAGIDITSDVISNAGVRSVATGASNGTISVNTNGTSAEVAVYGLGSAAYTASTDYATAAQGGLADTAVQPSDLANYVTTGTNQDITGVKTFIGEKRIKFKQSASGNKLGFTLYDNNNKEAAAFEYRPNTINSYPLMYLGQYKGSGTSYISTPIYVGFRCYDTAYNASYNLVAPLAKDAKTPFSLDTNYKTLYLPLGVTDGNTTVTTGSNGVLDISSLLSGGGSSYTAGTGIDITNDVISVEGVKDQQNTSTAIKTWTGTRAQYDAIVTKDSNTLYNVTDDSNMAVSLLQTIYPVGSIYIGTMNTCPLAALFGTWTLVAANRVLQGSGNYNAGSTVEAGLPNITGYMTQNYQNATGNDGGALYRGSTATNATYYVGSGWGGGDINFDASRSNPIYGNSLTVQPPAYVVNIWERTA